MRKVIKDRIFSVVETNQKVLQNIVTIIYWRVSST